MQQISLLKNVRLSVRWLAIALLLFAQLSLATHYHDIGDVQQHDCSLCSQLQSVGHPAAQTGAISFPTGAHEPPFHCAASAACPTRVYLPPCRAPPLA